MKGLDEEANYIQANFHQNSAAGSDLTNNGQKRKPILGLLSLRNSSMTCENPNSLKETLSTKISKKLNQYSANMSSSNYKADNKSRQPVTSPKKRTNTPKKLKQAKYKPNLFTLVDPSASKTQNLDDSKDLTMILKVKSKQKFKQNMNQSE